MPIFDNKGMLIIPNPAQAGLKTVKKILVLKECFCPNKHNLINSRVSFNNYAGILIKVRNKQKKEGMVALSPIFGDKSRIAIDIDLVENEILELLCPQCDVMLPVYSQCYCKASLVAFFTTEALSFADCAGVCNRVGCVHAELKNKNELLDFNMLDML